MFYSCKPILDAELKAPIKCDSVKYFTILHCNSDPASERYVRNKIKDCSKVDVVVNYLKFEPGEIGKILEEIKIANQDERCRAIMLQLPVEGASKEIVQMLQRNIAPEKDVDGVHPMTKFTPCTAKGVIDLVNRWWGTNTKNLSICVVGAGNVGKEIIKELLKTGFKNLSICTSKTHQADLMQKVSESDLVISCAGVPNLIRKYYTGMDTTYLVDVGITEVNGELYGDIEPGCADGDNPFVLQTPVPGGVGLLTRAALIQNLREAFED